jgi:predicted amidohydrolase
MDKLIITTIQTDLHWENKVENLEMLGNKIMGIKEKTNIVVLPEMFSTGFTMKPEVLAEKMDGETIAWMRNIAREKGIILAGSLSIEEEGEYYNRFIWMLPNGKHGHYDKRHCFTLGGEDEHYVAGNKRTIASVGGWKINLQICYDLRFPVWARQQTNADPEKEPAPEYDLLINVANWPERRSHHWKTLLQARAIENQCFVVGVNRVGNDGNGLYHSGDSMVIDPLGQILYHQSKVEDIHTTMLEKSQLDEVRTRLPFWKDGDHFLLV